MTDEVARDTPSSDHGRWRTRPTMVGNSAAMLGIKALFDRIADTNITACVWGEPGTGKRLAARVLHDRSPRREGPFLVVDCTGHSEEALEIILFGPFGLPCVGRSNGLEGVLAQSRSGTLVLAELQTVGFRLQERLLETLRTGRLPASGGATSSRFNSRLIATMSRNPVHAVENGSLIEDLYYRVAVAMIKMPALRERADDIPILSEHLLRRCAIRYRRPMIQLAPGILARMIPLPWPGNVRQLEELLAQAFMLADGDMITDRDLSRAARAIERAGGPNPLRKVS